MSRNVHDWIIIDDIAVTITRGGESRDAVWREFADELTAKKVTKLFGGATRGVQMTSVQRKIVGDALSKNKIQVVAITDDALARGVITAISWLGVNIRAWSWDQVNEAVKLLGVSPTKERTLVETLLLLRDRGSGR